MDNTPPHEEREERDPATGALMILLFIVLLFGKALDMPISWWLVTAPIWGSFLYFMIRDAFRK